MATRRPTWVAPVERFCRALNRAVFGTRTHPPDDPVQVDAMRQMESTLNGLLQTKSPVTLELRGRTVLWSSEPVFEDQDIEGGLVTALSTQGIEQLSFHTGITLGELQMVVGVLAAALSRRTTGDVTTRLWCLDATHFSYVVSDPFDPIAPTNRPLSPELDQYRQLVLHVADVAAVVEPPAEALAAWAAPPPLPWIEALDDELSERRAELSEQDALRPLMARASLLLLGALGAEAEPTVDTPAWRLLSDLLKAVVCNGRFAEAQALLDRMNNYAQRATSPNVRRMVDGVLLWLGSDEMVGSVLNILDRTGDAAIIRSAVGYLQRLGPGVDATVWRLAGRVRNDIARHHLADVLVEAAERDPRGAISQLEQQQSPMVADIVARAEARRTRGADLLWWYGLEHRDPLVRAPATKLLRRRDGEVTEAVLVTQLDDPDPQVRLAALDAIGRRPRQDLLNRIQGYFKPERLEQASEVELSMAMTAFARILGARAVPQLAHFLNEGHRLRLGAKTLEVQMRAAQLLGAIPDGTAVKALQFGARSRTAKIKQACQRALEGAYAQALMTDPVAQHDLSPRPDLLASPVRATTTPGRSASAVNRRLARGIVGLPAEDRNIVERGSGGG